MQVRADKYDVGVIVARFQVHELHEAHLDLVETVLKAHENGQVIIFLGLSPVRGTANNPLDFVARAKMLQQQLPDVTIQYVEDVRDDVVWSRKLDRGIERVTNPNQSVVLYGSRDSFIDHYHGKHATIELEQEIWVSGTELRKTITNQTKASPDFRAGAIWATAQRYPAAIPTVDVAVFNDEGDKLLLARKADEKLFRFIGGFAQPDRGSYEADARAEVQEEAQIAITDPQYVTSMLIDDWRYRGEVDQIKTLLFEAKHLSGRPLGDDDVAEVRWFDVATLSTKDIMEEHRPVLEALQEKSRLIKREEVAA